MKDMDIAVPIDLSTWSRREHFEHYMAAVPCTYSLTVELDVTEFVEALRRSSYKTYIAQIWVIAAVVNRHSEFKMCLTESNEPEVWDTIHPAFTVFNAELETFSSVWVRFEQDFAMFHEAAARVLAEHRHTSTMFPQGSPPSNTFDVSSLPWTSFTGMNLNVRDNWRHLAPIFTLGRYLTRNSRVLLPLAVQVHHAAADGFHAARLINELQDLFASPEWVSAP